MGVNVGHVSIAVSCIIASLLLLYGYMGYQKLQAANMCKMTYSRPQKTEIKLADKNPWSYKLWKLTNGDNKRFNKHPILFIPGHLGSADQARSFASYMHNEDNSLQYFAVDFHGEVMGLHGSGILHKAAFVNVALRTIIALYQAQGFLTDDIHVTLLGHSYGGYVAKASVVLNNHPRPCAVDLIVMLSAPNTKAALVPDASHDVHFRSINKAWYTPFYEHSKQCDSRSDKLGLNSGELSLSSDCQSCVPHIQLLSLVGGENDMHIDASTSDVFAISAHPRNITAHPVKGSSSSMMPQLVTFELIGMVKNYFKRQLNAVLNIFSIFSSAKSSVVTNNQTATEEAEAELLEPNNTTTTDTIPIIDPASPYAFITSENWYKHIAPYTEPRHITVRASQLTGVGFPVDHYAILWCHQFVSVVNTAIKQLVGHPTAHSTAFDLHHVLGIQAQERIENATVEAAKLGIPELTDYIRRNVSNALFIEGKKVDELFIFDKLGNNYLQYFLVKFVLRSLPTVLVFTFVLSLLVLISALLRAIEGNKASYAVFTIYSMPISLDLVPIQLALMTSWEAAATAAGSSWSLLTCIMSVAAVLVYRFKHVATLALVQDMMGCLLAFFLACTVRVLLILVISLLQLVYRTLCAFLRLIYVKKMFKSLSKRLLGKDKVAMAVWSVVPETMVAVVLVVVMYLRKRSISHIVSESGLLLSIVIVWLYGSLLMRVGMSLIGADGKQLHKRTTVTQDVISELSVLYLFGLAAAAPSMLFALKQIVRPDDAFLYNSKLFDMLSSTRVNYLLILVTLWFSSRYFADRNYEYKAEVWSFLAAKNSNKKNKRGAKEAATTECLHEDGGKNAVFQAVHSSETQMLNNGAIIGATYKVIKCFCPSDRELKTSDEWCEWCQCTKCGYGSRLKYSAEVDNVPTLSTDIFMIAALAGTAGFVLIYGQLQFYVVLIAVGSVGASFVARNWYGRGTIVLTMPAM